jgi:hypothetical protein
MFIKVVKGITFKERFKTNRFGMLLDLHILLSIILILRME